MALEMLGEVLETELKRTIAAGREQDGDFRGECGLLFCGNCGEPKEAKVEIFGTLQTVPCMCRCAEEEWKRREAEQKEEQRRLAIERLRVNGIQDEHLHNCRFETAEDSEGLQKCRRFVDHWEDIRRENTGLLMSGPVGTGKTFAAACIANALIDRRVSVLMTSFPAVLGARYALTDLIKEANKFDLIIVDDLGTERDTDYAAEVVFQFVDARYRAGKPMIVTTNLSPKDLRTQPDLKYRRIYDRILEMCVPMVFSGENKRTAKQKQKASTLRSIILGTEELESQG